MLAFWLYRTLTWLTGPLFPLVLWFRELKGKEERVRRPERQGQASLIRPHGYLIWVHVASVGESLSVLPLIHRLLERQPHAHILVTSTTVTSAKILGTRLPQGAFHQFIPVDRPKWVRAFFDKWRPDLCLFVESELWPNLIHEAKRRKRRLVLINGRMSKRSAERWAYMPGFIAYLLKSFSLCLVQDQEQVERYKKLGADSVFVAGNLKLVDGTLSAKNDQPAQSDAQTTNQAQLRRDDPTLVSLRDSKRPIWLAASTHPGEEEKVVELHLRLRERIPNLLTLLAPRHPERRSSILALLQRTQLSYVTRTSSASVEAEHDMFLLDTIGELSHFYSFAEVSLICGSLIPGIGGHNPVEGAHKGSALVLGPHMSNFRLMTRNFLKVDAAQQGFSQDELFSIILGLLTNPSAREKQSQAAHAFLNQHKEVPETIVKHLLPFLPALQEGEQANEDNNPVGEPVLTLIKTAN